MKRKLTTSSMKLNLLKQTLFNYSKNIEKIIDLLETEFQNKFLLHFYINCFDGYEFSIKNKFLATNILPEDYKGINNEKNDFILLRFFCNTNKSFSLNDHHKFCMNLTRKNSSPIFFATPYQDSYNDENSFIIEPKFEFKIFILKDKIKYKFNNYSENINIFEKIQNKLILLLEIPENITNIKNNTKNINTLLSKNIIESIEKAKKYMISGDCYLANITKTQVISSEKSFITASNFFKSWLSILSRFGIYYKDCENGIACFSPERYLSLRNGIVISEPIKGTVKSLNIKPTLKDAKKIWDSKKEIYEHTLTVDLIRNDLYNVCTPGSVVVYLPFFAKISGSLIQMQSSIIGMLKENENLSTCLLKMLPAGSITGTPKKRVCEIIANIETTKRGYYTGVCGILEKNGNFDSTILIRSIYMGKRGVYFGVGAGITTLSNSQLEYEEFIIKLNSFSNVFESLIL